MRSDEECAKISERSIREISEASGFRLEVREGVTFLTSEADGTTYRLATGQGSVVSSSKGELLILLGWDEAPLPFALVPRPGLTYFDLRFGTHSRELNAVASALKLCLERNGCAFRTFSTAHKPGRRFQGWRRYLRR